MKTKERKIYETSNKRRKIYAFTYLFIFNSPLIMYRVYDEFFFKV